MCERGERLLMLICYFQFTSDSLWTVGWTLGHHQRWGTPHTTAQTPWLPRSLLWLATKPLHWVECIILSLLSFCWFCLLHVTTSLDSQIQYFCWVLLSSVLWYCWLGLLTCKNRLPYNLYCVGGDVKHCSIQSNAQLSRIQCNTICWYSLAFSSTLLMS